VNTSGSERGIQKKGMTTRELYDDETMLKRRDELMVLVMDEDQVDYSSATQWYSSRISRGMYIDVARCGGRGSTP